MSEVNVDIWAEITKALVWPVTIVVLILILRKAVMGAISRIKGVEGPTGWKLLFEVRKLGESFPPACSKPPFLVIFLATHFTP